MKKFYILIAAASVAITGMASSAAGNSLRIFSPNKEIPQIKNLASSKINNPESKLVKELQKTDGATEEISGTWTFTVGDYYFEDSSGEYIDIVYEATVDGNEVTFSDPTGNRYPLKAIFDSSKQTFTFERTLLGQENGDDLYLQPCSYDYTANKLVPVDAIVAPYYSNIGVMSFDFEACTMTWEAYRGNSFRGYYDILDFFAGINSNVSTSDDADWVDYGMATFMDGWLLPAFDIDQYSNKYEVPIQVNRNNSNLYRLVNPYNYGPMVEYNESTTGGYIVFDVTDPDHVVFKTAEAGFVNSSLGISAFYCYNQLGSLVASYPEYTVKEIIDLQEGYSPWTTFKDGVVELSSIISIENNLVYDANFGYQASPFGGYYWTNDGDLIDMTTSIELPKEDAVEAIGVDNKVEKVELYDVNGLKVINPTPGQVIIKKSGSKVIKEIVR